MSVSHLAVVYVSAKLLVSQLQVPASVKNSSLKPNSYFHTSPDLRKGTVKNGSYKQPVLSNIFSIQFIYLQKLINTTVMKINYGHSNPFYKVVLTAIMHNSGSLWWLELQPHGWAILLGPKLNENLKYAIISAIESHEFTSVNNLIT